MITGFATSEGTARFAQKNQTAAKDHFRQFTGLTLSSIGVGTYLGNADDATDILVKDAVKKSVLSSVNVIDTAINYRSQKAERSVGKAISELVEEGKIKREEVFISTKNGYVTNDADVKEDFWQYINSTLVKSGIIKPDDISSGYHCMTIPYLENQLNKSLNNLDVNCVDLMYLHNAAEGQLQDISKEQFMKNLSQVFEFYEMQRKQGTIRYYGMATWDCFRVPKEHPQHLLLSDVLRLAKEAGGNEHGFRFIQLPYNMYFDQALVMKNQTSNSSEISILDSAIKLGVGVFASVPLMQAKLLGPNVIPEFGGLKPAHRALQFVRSTPGIIAPLVGHKTSLHVDENLEIVKIPPMSETEFHQLLKNLTS
jgi:aryl-alcohol dehydrogenase-like predicted oxidoreductase